MGVSTDAILCYGIPFDEYHEFPWNRSEDRYAEEWYFSGVMGFKHTTEIFDSDGEYLGGVEPSQEVIDAYFKERNEFREKHPMPFKVVMHCSCEYPMYILAVPGTVAEANRGYPREIDSLHADQDAVYEFIRFLKEHKVIDGESPTWLLASMWG